MTLNSAIEGLDKVIRSETRKGSVILITGEPGTLKTVLTFSLMNGMLKDEKDKVGVYVTLEETREDHLWNMKSFGIAPVDNLKIYDIGKFKSNMKLHDRYSIISKDFMEMTMRAVYMGEKIPEGDDKQLEKPLCYALDSLNALLTLSKVDIAQRREFIQELFFYLKEQKVTCFIIWEDNEDYKDPFFLADGVIELGFIPKQNGEPDRYLKIRKLKGVKHYLGRFIIEIGKNGIEIISKKV